MEHSFDVKVAKDVGVNCAIILKNIVFWIKKNYVNKKNMYEGNYWTYNSVKAWSGLFPYFTDNQIRTALDKLQKQGYIIKGNFNEIAYDRTSWYAINALSEKGKCILEEYQIHLGLNTNGFAKKPEPIPDSKTYSKPDEKKTNKKDFFLFDKELVEVVNHWNKYAQLKSKKQPKVIKISNELKKIFTKVKKEKKYTLEQIKKAIDNFDIIENDENYFLNLGWNFITFLKQKNALPDFIEESYKNKETGEIEIELGQKILAYNTRVKNEDSKIKVKNTDAVDNKVKFVNYLQDFAKEPQEGEDKVLQNMYLKIFRTLYSNYSREFSLLLKSPFLIDFLHFKGLIGLYTDKKFKVVNNEDKTAKLDFLGKGFMSVLHGADFKMYGQNIIDYLELNKREQDLTIFDHKEYLRLNYIRLLNNFPDQVVRERIDFDFDKK